MDTAAILRRARSNSGLSLRALARRSGTSHSTIAAYEAGRVVPGVDTLDRILRSTGHSAHIVLGGLPDATPSERLAKGRELVQVLDLAAEFPARHEPTITFPRFPTSTR